MIINQNTKKWISDFKKKFVNFCEKSPLLLSYELTDTSVLLFEQTYTTERNLMYTHHFDFNESIQLNISKIKDWLLENKCPVMIQQDVSYREFTSEEMQIMINDGLSLDEVIERKKVKKE